MNANGALIVRRRPYSARPGMSGREMAVSGKSYQRPPAADCEGSSTRELTVRSLPGGESNQRFDEGALTSVPL